MPGSQFAGAAGESFRNLLFQASYITPCLPLCHRPVTEMRPALALYQPDIAGNTGTLIRLSACMGTELHIIGPAGFRDDDSALRRAGMDYAEIASVTRHAEFAAFDEWRKRQRRRIVLATTSASLPYTGFGFVASAIILLGRESSGVPAAIHDGADARSVIPMIGSARSLNQAVSGAMILGEALRQTGLSASPGGPAGG